MRIIYGINPVAEAIKTKGGAVTRIVAAAGRHGKAFDEIARAAAKLKIPVETVDRKELDTLAGTPNHQGIAAVMAEDFRYADIEDLISAWKASGEKALIIVIDSVQDPQNLGSLIRSAEAAGAHGVIIPRDRACEVTPVVVKASAGATEHVMIAREVNLSRAIERLKKENVWTVAVEAGAKESIYRADLDIDLALVIGSEGAGIRRLVKESCDFSVHIPMGGRINSLNAAAAGAVAMFEARRRKE